VCKCAQTGGGTHTHTHTHTHKHAHTQDASQPTQPKSPSPNPFARMRNARRNQNTYQPTRATTGEHAMLSKAHTSVCAHVCTLASCPRARSPTRGGTGLPSPPEVGSAGGACATRRLLTASTSTSTAGAPCVAGGVAGPRALANPPAPAALISAGPAARPRRPLRPQTCNKARP
jgi:hypothetical protein